MIMIIQDIIQSVNDLKQSYELMSNDSIIDSFNGIILKLQNLENKIMEEKKIKKVNQKLIENNFKLIS